MLSFLPLLACSRTVRCPTRTPQNLNQDLETENQTLREVLDAARSNAETAQREFYEERKTLIDVVSARPEIFFGDPVIRRSACAARVHGSGLARSLYGPRNPRRIRPTACACAQ